MPRRQPAACIEYTSLLFLEYVSSNPLDSGRNMYALKVDNKVERAVMPRMTPLTLAREERT
jgi:hypothetical protein